MPVSRILSSLPLDGRPVKSEEAARMVPLQPVQDAQHEADALGHGEELGGLHVGLEGRRQVRRGRAWVERDAPK